MISASANTALQSDNTMLHLDHMQMKPPSPPSSSRILDIPCKVCGDFSSGKHYNIFACDGCAGFFKRSIRRNRKYSCKAKDEGRCVIDKTHRNQCRACRLQKCEEAGMNKDAVQHERGPRSSTLRRQQMSNYFNDNSRVMMSPSSGGVLNLTVPKSEAPRLEHVFPMIPPSAFMFNTMAPPRLPAPVPQTNMMSPIILSSFAIWESAASLLFMNVRWTKSFKSFTSLPLSDQLILLEESWREHFILAAAQFLLPLLDINSLLYASGFLQRSETEKATIFLQEVKEFQETLTKLNHFQLDTHEFDCLKAIVLFKTNLDKTHPSASPSGETKFISDPTKVAMIQEDSQLALNKYISTTHPDQPLRFGKILMLLPSLRNISENTIEELFFRKTIGNFPVVQAIWNAYKSQAQGGCL